MQRDLSLFTVSTDCFLVRGLALAHDYVPIIDAWGSTCIWVGRKR